MPIKIVRDYRELLIDIFFAVIIAVGLDRFVRECLLRNYLGNLNSFDFESISKVFSTPATPATPSGISIMFDMLFFFVAYFWVISHWVFYHELITKYPYYRWRKFFVDIALFSIMFIVLNISYHVDKNVIALHFVGLIIIWYFFACLWHLSDKGLRPLRSPYMMLHINRLTTYIPLMVFLYFTSIYPVHPLYRYIVMMAVIVAMVVWSVHRLSRFLKKDSRRYVCHLERKDGTDLPGELELISYPMKERIGDNDRNGRRRDRIWVRRRMNIFKLLRKYNLPDTKMSENGRDKIIFCPLSKDKPIVIFPETIKKVCVQRMSDDLKLRINYTDQNDGTAKDVLFNIADVIIGSVKKGIEELSERNKHGDSTETLVCNYDSSSIEGAEIEFKP